MAAADTNVMRELVLAELRCAFLRAKSAELEIQQISELLKLGGIEPAAALIALEQLGWASLLGAEIREMVDKTKRQQVRGAHAG